MYRFPYLVLAIILFTSTVAGCRIDSPDTTAPEPTILTVPVIKPRRLSEFSYPVIFYGRIQTARRTSLAFEIPGQITELLMDEGETITAGKPVARLDTSILEAERKKLLSSKTVEQTILRRLKKGERDEVISAARAMVSRMDAELEQAVRDRDRLEILKAKKVASVSEYEGALFKAKSLKASLDAAKARLLELETGTREEDIEAQNNRILELDAQIAVMDSRIDKAILSAPFTAHVIQRMVDEGAVVQEGQPVLILSEADQYEARFSVPVTQLDEAKAAKSIFVSKKEVTIKKVRMISSLSDDTRTVDVIFSLNENESVIEGQTCSLKLTERVNTTCIKLPLSALVPSVRGLWSIYCLKKDDSSENYRVLREDLTINHSDGDSVFVETAIPDGSLVVSKGTHKLVPGMLVQLKDVEP